MALASRSCSSLPLHLLRYASSHQLGALHHRRPRSARLQLSAAASSYKEAARNDGITAAAATCAPVVEVVDAATSAEQLGKKAARGGAALPGYPHDGPPRPSPPKEVNRRDMSNPSPPGPPMEGSGGNGGAHN